MQPFVDLSDAVSQADDDELPFRFPLDDASVDAATDPARFCERSSGGSPYEYHAAEDYHQPPGTPVYAMADGEISFSGRAGGYGWLVIIDHPQANVYSLYGHLSPSRWRMAPGSVEKGDLIAYLGDQDENGGSAEDPLVPHLHLGVRTGQRSDYPGAGEWRWQAGWIKPCPADLGWLRPSAIIAGQEIPDGGFPEPSAGFASVWGVELMLGGVYLVFAVCAFIFATKKDRPILLVLSGVALGAAGWILHNKGMRMSYGLALAAISLALMGVVRIVRRSR